jgi:hypothetical protein
MGQGFHLFFLLLPHARMLDASRLDDSIWPVLHILSFSLSPHPSLHYKFLLTHNIVSFSLSPSPFLLFLFFVAPLCNSSGDSDCICHIENPTIRPYPPTAAFQC